MREFLQAYLEAMGDPASVQDIDALMIDCQIAILYRHHFSALVMFPLLAKKKKQKEKNFAGWLNNLNVGCRIIERIFSTDAARRDVLTHSLQHFMPEMWEADMGACL